MTPRRPTIIDVARKAGVSKSLVSLALRGSPSVKAETREKIIAAADDLGYQTNAWARSLVSGQSRLIGVVLTDLANPYGTEIINALEVAVEARGYGVLIGHGRRKPEVLEKRVQQLMRLGVDGMVVVSGHLDPAFLARMARAVPLVVVGKYDGLDIDSVTNDDTAGARLAMSHLVEQGHERIAHLTMSPRPATRERLTAVRGFSAEHGLDTRFIRPEDIDGIGHAWANDPAAPTAVFASNDVGALRVISEVRGAGLHVPQDIAVVGYDNSALARSQLGGLTSVDQPRELMGNLAAEMILERIEGRTDVRHEIVEPTLVIRGSTSGTAGCALALTS